MFKEEVIFSYSTKMAVDDGVLIPIPRNITGPLGISVPDYFNDSVWNHYVNSSVGSPDFSCDGNVSAICRILNALIPVARQCGKNYCEFDFMLPEPLWLTNCRNEVLNSDESMLVRLKSVIAAEDFDKPNPALFLMLPWED